MSYITNNEFEQIVTLPISLPQTELRSRRYIQVGTYPVLLGQRLELRVLTIHLVSILTPGVLPQIDSTVLSLCSAGLLIGSMATSVIGAVYLDGLGAGCWNAVQPVIVTAPGTYRIVAFNNSSNVDLSVAVTGSIKFFL